jgi:isoquinoline 1-oxidoreductase alpha subunit
MINFTLNGKAVSVDAPGDTPLLWTLRNAMPVRSNWMA